MSIGSYASPSLPWQRYNTIPLKAGEETEGKGVDSQVNRAERDIFGSNFEISIQGDFGSNSLLSLINLV